MSRFKKLVRVGAQLFTFVPSQIGKSVTGEKLGIDSNKSVTKTAKKSFVGNLVTLGAVLGIKAGANVIDNQKNVDKDLTVNENMNLFDQLKQSASEKAKSLFNTDQGKAPVSGGIQFGTTPQQKQAAWLPFVIIVAAVVSILAIVSIFKPKGKGK
jgi:hypothetical protein